MSGKCNGVQGDIKQMYPGPHTVITYVCCKANSEGN